jgi:hypothetical protein
LNKDGLLCPLIPDICDEIVAVFEVGFNEWDAHNETVNEVCIKLGGALALLLIIIGYSIA